MISPLGACHDAKSHGATSRRLPSRRRAAGAVKADDAGMAGVVVLLLTPVLFGLGGLVLDGGTHLAARQRTAGLAEQAARAGADQLDISSLRATGLPTLDEGAAREMACRYARTVEPDVACTAAVAATATGPEVQVRLRAQTATVLLGLIGINLLHTDAIGTAQAVTGIRTPGESP
ncbi:MAG: TadE family protein [Frankiales bacterium]|jgi:Flp pilus assembly protein TadG|nr:TadE family protein [Frankiales bacterium]